jgi:hypothetical protein
MFWLNLFRVLLSFSESAFPYLFENLGTFIHYFMKRFQCISSLYLL